MVGDDGGHPVNTELIGSEVSSLGRGGSPTFGLLADHRNDALYDGNNNYFLLLLQ